MRIVSTAYDGQGPGASVDAILQGQRTPSAARTRSSVEPVPVESPIRWCLAQSAEAA
jgi:hypothetical protein